MLIICISYKLEHKFVDFSSLNFTFHWSLLSSCPYSFEAFVSDVNCSCKAAHYLLHNALIDQCRTGVPLKEFVKVVAHLHNRATCTQQTRLYFARWKMRGFKGHISDELTAV